MLEPGIILVAGPLGGGKTTTVKPYVDVGCVRINRDDLGGGLQTGGLSDQVLRSSYAQGKRAFVCDNTFATVASRKVFIDIARDLGLPIHLKWLETTREQGQFFAARRQMQRLGRILRAEEYKDHKGDPNMFPPVAQFTYWKKVEPPEESEGFDSIEMIPVTVNLGPEYDNEAVIFDFDGTLRKTKSGKPYPSDPDDVELLPGCKEKIVELGKAGVLMLGASNQSGIGKPPDHEEYVSEAQVCACFDRTKELLGEDIEVIYSTERGGMAQSFWPKPLPGMGVYFIEKYKLDPAKVVFVGDMTKDKTFAERCGFQFIWAKDFF